MRQLFHNNHSRNLHGLTATATHGNLSEGKLPYKKFVYLGNSPLQMRLLAACYEIAPIFLRLFREAVSFKKLVVCTPPLLRVLYPPFGLLMSLQLPNMIHR